MLVVPVSVSPAGPLVDGGSDRRCRRVGERRRWGGRRYRGGGRGRRRRGWRRGRRRGRFRSRSGRRPRRRRRRLAGRALLRARPAGRRARGARAVVLRRGFAAARLTRVEGRGRARRVGRHGGRRRLRPLHVRRRMPGRTPSVHDDRLAPNHAKPIRGESSVHRARARRWRRFPLRLGGRGRRLVEQPPQLVVALQSRAPQVAGGDRRGDQAEDPRRREVELHAASIAGRSDGARDRYSVLSLRFRGVQGGVGALQEPVGRIAFVAGNSEACRVLDADGLR